VLDAASTAEPPVGVSSATVTIDRTRPTESGLLVSPLTGTDLQGTSLRLHVAWTAADTGGSGIGHFELQASTDGGTTWSPVATALPTPAANVLAASSGTVRYRVSAVDKAGNVGMLTGLNLTPRLIQNTSTAITYSTGWTLASSPSYSGGSVRFATVAGKSASFKFTGRTIAYVTTRAANRGKVKVFVDGILMTTLDLSGPSKVRFVAWQQTWSTSAPRTIRLVVVGPARVDLDAFAVIS